MTHISTPTNMRKTARAILFDEKGRVYLFKHEYCNQFRWFTPGGKIEEGETKVTALKRELKEELGLSERQYIFLSPKYVEYEHSSVWQGTTAQSKDYIWFLRVMPESSFCFSDMTRDETKYIIEGKWMSVQEMEESRDLFVPHNIISLIRNFVTQQES